MRAVEYVMQLPDGTEYTLLSVRPTADIRRDYAPSVVIGIRFAEKEDPQFLGGGGLTDTRTRAT